MVTDPERTRFVLSIDGAAPVPLTLAEFLQANEFEDDQIETMRAMQPGEVYGGGGGGGVAWIITREK